MGVNGIYGLSGSGMDIESMVKIGMMSKQNEYDKMAQKYTKNEWMKTDYLDVSSKITTFSANLTQYKMSNTMNAKSAEAISDAVKITASASSSAMSHSVEVDKLSTNAYLVSTEKLTRYSEDQTSIDLKDVLFKSLTDNNDGNVTVETIDGKTATVSKTQDAISFELQDGTVDADKNPNKATIKFTYEEILGGATLNDLASKIKDSGLKIKASYDSYYDRFSIYNPETGSDNKISISLNAQDVSSEDSDTSNPKTYSNVVGSNTASFLNALQLYKSKDGDIYSPVNDKLKTDSLNGGAWTFTAGEQTTTGATTTTSQGTTQSLAGENGIMKIDGVLYDQVKGNSVTVDGVTYTALKKTEDANGNIRPTTVGITQDTDAIIEKVKSFISDYNTLLSDLYKRYDEKPNTDYKPLTQTQKDSMKEEQIEKWEEKAKAGMLYHDQTLGRIINKLRTTVTDSVELGNGKTASIFNIGISTTGLKGQLTLDEDKLKKALSEDSEIVYKVLSKPSDKTKTVNGKEVEDTSYSGIVQRISDIAVEANKNIKTRAGSTASITEDSDLNNLLRNLQTRMSNFKKMMNAFETALYKKYDTMESTLARLGTQLNYIMGGQTS